MINYRYYVDIVSVNIYPNNMEVGRMVIQNSVIGMNATYHYSKKTENSVTYTSWGNIMNQYHDQTAVTLPSATDSAQDTNGSTKEENHSETILLLMQGTLGTNNIVLGEKEEASYEGIDKLEHNSLRNLFELLFSKGDTKKISAKDMFQQLLTSYRQRAKSVLEGRMSYRDYYSNSNGVNQTLNHSIGIIPVWGQELTISEYYHEAEQTSFFSSGVVRTQDGREIEFSVSATMSRSFLSYSSASIDYVSASLVDPLIINLTDEGAQVSDQKFLFDIDADGTVDNISLLTRYCAFLALDKNQDGIINDGSELFGTKTGDGFAELSIFDMDNNGWIDENDEIFNHLRIWHKDESGNDELVALGVAGIGAIYLGSRETRFSLNDVIRNKTNGMIQKTGIYLKEDGTAGTIQHVDFSKDAV